MIERLYVVTRRDLAPCDQAVQGIHAAVDFVLAHPEAARTWHTASNTVALLAVADETDLISLHRRADRHALKSTVFHEPDLDHAVTAVALEPGARRLVRKLDLALKERAVQELNPPGSF